MKNFSNILIKIIFQVNQWLTWLQETEEDEEEEEGES